MKKGQRTQIEQGYSSLLNYYRMRKFNPVPIDIENTIGWESHKIKRRSLYERHLMIPVSSFGKSSVLEFGCNSGENALYLAYLGANLTLVEPNEQVLPRLKKLFGLFDLSNKIDHIANTNIADFKTDRKYDIVIAEGFLNQLFDGKDMFLKICKFIKPDGIGIISFDDLYGSMIEMIRQMVFRRACQLKGIEDRHSSQSLALARELYEEDFKQLSASRPFEAWWADVIVSPFVGWQHFWTYKNVISLLEKAGCEFYSSSPKWSRLDFFRWYKNGSFAKERHRQLLQEWRQLFGYFITGMAMQDNHEPAATETVETVSALIKKISEYVNSAAKYAEDIVYPTQLDDYFRKNKNEAFVSFNEDMHKVFAAVKTEDFNELIRAYHNTNYLRRLWGTHGHYVSFIKNE